MKQKFKNIFTSDWIDILCKKYFDIDPFYKKVFWCVFITLNLVYLFYSIHFLWGNHDWDNIKYGVSFNYFFYEGRYSASAIKAILTQGQILPVLNTLLGFFGFCLSSLFLLHYWKLKKEFKYWMISCLLLTLAPFVNSWLWFSRHTIENLSAPLFVILGLILSLLSNTKFPMKNFLINLAAIFLMTFALGIYPSVLVNIAVIFFARVFIELLETDFNRAELLKKLFMFKRSVINILCSCVLYKLILAFMAFCGILSDMKNIQCASLKEILANFFPTLGNSFAQLVSYYFPCIPVCLTVYFLILGSFVLLMILSDNFRRKTDLKTKFKRMFLILFFLSLVVFSTKLAMLLAVDNINNKVRIDFYGLNFLRVLFVVLLFKYLNNNFVKNIVYVLCFLILHTSIVCDFGWQKALKLGFDAEKIQIDRARNLILSNPDYVSGKKYKCIMVRSPYSYVAMFSPPLLYEVCS